MPIFAVDFNHLVSDLGRGLSYAVWLGNEWRHPALRASRIRSTARLLDALRDVA
jgi:hypothetical protein